MLGHVLAAVLILQNHNMTDETQRWHKHLKIQILFTKQSFKIDRYYVNNV